MDVEKKSRVRFLAGGLLLAMLGGAIVGFTVAGAGRRGPAPGSGLEHRKIEALERGLEEGSERSREGIERALEGFRRLEGRARALEGGIGGIGKNADGTGTGLGDLEGIIAELQRRSKKRKP
jgi:hypothetical protein